MNGIKEARKEQFDHDTYVRYLKHNPIEAEKYINSFKIEKKEQPIEQTTTQEIQQPLEAKTEQSEAETIEKVIVFTDEDVKELRKVYKKESWKNAFGGWKWPELVQRINNLKSN